MTRSGFVKLRRGIIDHMASMAPVEFKVFIALLTLADHQTHSVRVPITELCSLIGATRKSIGAAIVSLSEGGYILYEPGQNQWQFSSFTIIKYNGDEEDTVSGCEVGCNPACVDTTHPTTQPTTQATSQAQASDLRKGASKNLRTKELKNKDTKGAGREDPDEKFLEFWTLYPKREGKQAALRCWSTRTKEGATADEILDGTRRYAAYCMANEYSAKHIKMPSTFLGPDKWYESEWKVDTPAKKPEDDYQLPTEYEYEPDPAIRRARWIADMKEKGIDVE